MIKKRLLTVVFLSILLTFVLTIPKVSGEASQKVIARAHKNCIKLPIL